MPAPIPLVHCTPPAFGYAPDGKIKPNAHAFKDEKGNVFYYSYQTLIAFRPVKGLFAGVAVCRENVWGNTTGKHLNWVTNGEPTIRFDEEAFNDIFNEHITKA